MIYSNIPLSKAHVTDGGYDLYAKPTEAKLLRLEPESITEVHTGVRVKIPFGSVGLVKERSGFPSRGLPLIILGGVIDSGYTGEIVVFIFNPADEPILIPWGKAIAQLVVVQLVDATLTTTHVVNDLGDTDRGSNGFGSTDQEAA
jgi:dUTP pyrophosphatase